MIQATATLAVGTPTHQWLDAPKGTLLSQGVAFRFCSRCDREEWANGAVRPGIDECPPISDPAAFWTKTDLGEGLRQDVWQCTEPACTDPLRHLVADAERPAHRLTYHDARIETGECGECDRPDQFAWDPIRWVDGAPVIVCLTHGGLAPGWAYATDVEVADFEDA